MDMAGVTVAVRRASGGAPCLGATSQRATGDKLLRSKTILSCRRKQQSHCVPGCTHTSSPDPTVATVTAGPSTTVRWLGFWFDQRRTGKVHFQKRAASTAITLRPLRSLSSPAKGLTPQNVHHLVQLVLRPRLLYGASIFSPREARLCPIRAV